MRTEAGTLSPPWRRSRPARTCCAKSRISNTVQEARQMVAKAAEKGVYLGCNLNHYFTPPAERAMQYIEDGQVGEMVYCLHKMGFNGGEATYRPMKAPRSWPFPYFHVKAFSGPSIQPHAPFLRGYHPRAGLFRTAQLSQGRRRQNALYHQHPRTVPERRGWLSAQPAWRRHLWPGRVVEL